MDATVVLLLIFAGIGFISKNSAIIYAMVILILLRIAHANSVFTGLEKYGVTIGITLLTASVMAPIANGKIPTAQFLGSLLQWETFLAIIAGMSVTYLAGRGLPLIGSSPHLVPGILVGTIIGIACLKGTPVGPLIAAGLLSLFLN